MFSFFRNALRKWKGSGVDCAPMNRACMPEPLVLDAVKVQPGVKVCFADIVIHYGARWVPVEVYKRFICWLYGWDESYMDSVRLMYVPQTDTYIGEVSGQCAKVYRWRVGRYSGQEMLIYTLMGYIKEFKRKEGGKLVRDEELCAQAARVRDEIEAEWQRFLVSPSAARVRMELEGLYNRIFCGAALRGYDAVEPVGLNLEGLGIPDLYDSQKQAVGMILSRGGGICWHQVGTGKTLIMCVAAHELHERGGVKSLLLGMKANVAQIAETYQTAYPSDKVLVPTKEDWARGDEFLQELAGDWACVIMSHDDFGRLPRAVRAERMELRAELESLRDSREQLYQEFYEPAVLRKLDCAIRKVCDKLNELVDEPTDFEDLGFSHIMLDESHCYKNLEFATRNMRVAGVGNPAGSKRAYKLLMAIRSIQFRTGCDLGATFLSATIVSNSLTELYVIFKYLRPRALQRLGICSFDAWASNFCEKKMDHELDIVGRLRVKERFSAYINVPELSQFLSEITDYRTSAMCQLDIPEGVTVLERMEPTPGQRMMLDRLSTMVRTRRWDVLGIAREEPENLQKSLMLCATSVARQISLDNRLLDNAATFGYELGCKLQRCAENIARLYHEFGEHNGTQFVFNDVGTLSDKWNIHDALRDMLVDSYGIPREEVAVINEATTDKKRLELFGKMNRGEVRVLMGSTTKLGTGVNAQERAVAVHHFDIPWRPSDMDQRNGRAVRKGNTVKEWGGNKVQLFIYATERTLDLYKLNLLAAKSRFIQELNAGTVSARRIDESLMSDEVGYAEMLSILSGNPELLRKSKLEARIMAMEKERKNFLQQTADARARMEGLSGNISKCGAWIQRTEAYLAQCADDALQGELAQKRELLAAMQQEHAQLATVASGSWAGEDELAELRAELQEVMARIDTLTNEAA